MNMFLRWVLIAVVVVSLGANPNAVWSQCILDVDELLVRDLGAGDQIGVSVSVSGGVAVVGAYKDDDKDYNSGAAYLFSFDDASWTPEQKLVPSDGAWSGFFGSSVAVSGDELMVGAPGDTDNGSFSGSVYVFRFNVNDATWIEEQKLRASDGTALDIFGGSVAFSGDVAVIGAVGDADNGPASGSAYVFRFNGSNWIEDQKLLAADGAENAQFGSSVAISGDVFVVGARSSDDNGAASGSAYVYRFDGASWHLDQKLLPSDGTLGDNFGQSVAISGDVIVIGASQAKPSYNEVGAAYVFRHNGSSWIQEAKLSSSGRFDHFGVSVAVDGNRAVIGGPTYSGTCELYYHSGCGVAYLFDFDGSNWIEQTELKAPELGYAGDQFGNSVAISGDVILVGGWGEIDMNVGHGVGSARVFTEQCEPSDCTSDSDCDDGNPCTVDVCTDGVCYHDGTGCVCEECVTLDADGDGDVDLADWAAVQHCFEGPG